MPREALHEAIEEMEATDLWIEDQNISGHIFLNRDFQLAQRAVEFMKTGTPTLPQPENETPPPEDTGEPSEEPIEELPEDTAAE